MDQDGRQRSVKAATGAARPVLGNPADGCDPGLALCSEAAHAGRLGRATSSSAQRDGERASMLRGGN